MRERKAMNPQPKFTDEEKLIISLWKTQNRKFYAAQLLWPVCLPLLFMGAALWYENFYLLLTGSAILVINNVRDVIGQPRSLDVVQSIFRKYEARIEELAAAKSDEA